MILYYLTTWMDGCYTSSFKWTTDLLAFLILAHTFSYATVQILYRRYYFKSSSFYHFVFSLFSFIAYVRLAALS